MNLLSGAFKFKLLLFCFVLLSNFSMGQQLTNPQTLSNQWPGTGFADPYILKYRGQYFMYCTTGAGQEGVKVWSSWDLLTWKYEGFCSTDPITKGAYAPEVLYYNGTFYMNTSPLGNGHYILTSNSPTGPFVASTGNLGHSIDGNIFVEDDGGLTFTHASMQGIIRHPMNTPLSINGGEQNTGANLNGWTEASFIFKRNGVYYMSYTGNHFLSNGYRVNYATSTNLTGTFTAPANNPIILNTEGGFGGLGHTCHIIGPDLDTWYVGYHNIIPGAARQFDLDPMGFNGTKMVVYGPTNWAQKAPPLPAFYDRFTNTTIDGSKWQNVNGGTWGIFNQELMWQDGRGTTTWYRQVSTQNSTSEYTAEFNMKEMNRGGNDGRYGAVFSYQNENNYGYAVFNSLNNTLEVNYIVNGVSQGMQSSTLLTGWDHKKWHTLRVEKHNNTFSIYVDQMLKSTRTIANLGGGKVGVTAYNEHADFGYTAFSNHSDGSAIYDHNKPIPGIIEAVHFNAGGEGVGYHDNTPANQGGVNFRNESVDIRDCPEGGHNVGWNTTGEWYKYNVNVKSAGNYHLGLRYATTNNACKVRFLCDGTAVTGTVDLPSTGGWDQWRTAIIPMITLPAGYHTLTMETVTGEFDFYTLNFKQAAAVTNTSDNFTTGFAGGWNYSDGSWTATGGTATLNNGCGKRLIGNAGWSDYIVETDIRLSANGNAGLLFRTQNPANGGANDDPCLGGDFSQGYFASIMPTGVLLGKFNYNWNQLSFVPLTMNVNQWYKVRVALKGSQIQIFVDDMNTPKLTYTDANPYLCGKAGLRVFNSSGTFDNFNIIDNTPPVANFSASKTTLAVAEQTAFTSTATGTIATYSWDFGAGATPATANTAGPHNVTYNSVGTKTVALTVTGSGGTNTKTSTNYITVVAAPVANFSASKTTAAIAEQIAFTNSSTGNITTYSWDFGSGATPATANTVGPHNVTYSSAGTKTVVLTVTGSGGINTKTSTNYITIVAAPVANFSASKTTAGINDQVAFTNSSTGNITTYSWDFGAGATPATANTVGPHNVTYSSAGTKTVVLTVTGPGGTNTKTSTNYITIVAAPVANFSASKTTAGINDQVAFTNSSTGNITTYSWDFGAGATPATANTVGPHNVTYSSAGTKTVVLTVAGPGGTNTKTSTNYITVVTGPVADFSASKTTAGINEQLAFTNSSTGSITTYSWDFGTGATPATANTAGPHNVTYSSAGTKTVVLTVAGPGGTNTKTSTNYITVVTGPVADFSASKTTAGINDQVAFTNSSTGSITTYSWDFGTGATPATANTAGPHNVTYSSAGTKTVVLTVAGPGGTNTKTSTNYITVAVAPVADFSALKTTVGIDDQVSFTHSSTGDITTYSWDFGVGATPATANTAGPHDVSYSSAGSKTVSLTVAGPGGSSSSNKTDYIIVSSTTNIDLNLKHAGIKVYPNPAKDYVTIEVDNTKSASVQIMNLSSQVVIDVKQIAGKEEVNITALPEGIYILIVKAGEETYISKMVKTN